MDWCVKRAAACACMDYTWGRETPARTREWVTRRTRNNIRIRVHWRKAWGFRLLKNSSLLFWNTLSFYYFWRINFHLILLMWNEIVLGMCIKKIVVSGDWITVQTAQKTVRIVIAFRKWTSVPSKFWYVRNRDIWITRNLFYHFKTRWSIDDGGKYKFVISVPDEVKDAQPDVEVLVLHLLQ